MAAICRSHCVACGCCFSGDTAFDLHLDRNYDDPDNPVVCIPPEDVEHPKTFKPRLEPAEGTCKLQRWDLKSGRGIPVETTVWRVAGAVEKARAAFGK